MDILLTIKFKYGVDVVFANDRLEASQIVRNLFKAYLKHKNKKLACKVPESQYGMFLKWKRKFNSTR